MNQLNDSEAGNELPAGLQFSERAKEKHFGVA